MKKINVLVLLASAAMLALLTTGCQSSRASTGTTPLPVVRVGSPVEVSGPVNVTGPITIQAAPAPAIVAAPAPAPAPAASVVTTATPTQTFSAVRSTATPGVFQATPGPAAVALPATTVSSGLGGERDSGKIELKKESMVTGTQVVPNGAVQIKKVVVTENVSQVVPVRREEYQVREIAVTDKTPTTPFESKEITIPLSREVPTGSTKAEVYRIIQVNTVTEVDNPTVQGQVRTEKVDVTREQK